jgi:hypothetical protein
MSFFFIQNLVSFDCELPYKLTNVYTLDRANEEQAKGIEEIFKKMRMSVKIITPYSSDHSKLVTVSAEGKPDAQVPTPRSKDDWLYWIIRYDMNTGENELRLALLLLKQEINLGFTFMEDRNGVMWNPHVVFQFYTDQRRFSEKFPVVVGEDQLAKVGHYLNLVTIASEKKTSAHSALKEFSDLNSLPYTSNLQILGCFAIIECLLTHNPNEKEIGDSLTHQLKTKLTLLERFFERSLDFKPFGSIKKEKVWTSLYSLRSAIAHGSRFVFEEKFAVLKSRAVALDFLREVAKLVILIALERPDFIEDLKAV